MMKAQYAVDLLMIFDHTEKRANQWSKMRKRDRTFLYVCGIPERQRVIQLLVFQPAMSDEENETGADRSRHGDIGWETYLVAQGWDDPLQPQHLYFHPLSPRMDPPL